MRNTDGKNRSAADALRTYAESENVQLTVREIDVTSDASVASGVEGLPTMDVLINNAGYGYGGPVEAFSSEQVLAQLDLNIVGTVRMAKAVLPGMRAQKSGLIIQVSSIAGRACFPAFGVYHASKWGLEGLSEAMRYELSVHGIDVVLVEPGPFETKFLDNVVPGMDGEIGQAYAHVNEFFAGFKTNVNALFQDENAPTDPMLVVEAFEKLIETPAGERPLRTIVGIDFGFTAINDAVEPIRKKVCEDSGFGDWDGPKA
jgi:short-subunit dehydrogenase